MVHYIFVAPSLIENLTTSAITCYNSSGNFFTFKPTLFTEDNLKKVYIVDSTEYSKLREKGISNRRLFMVAHSAIGRDGVRVSMLMTKNGDFRLMPQEE